MATSRVKVQYGGSCFQRWKAVVVVGYSQEAAMVAFQKIVILSVLSQQDIRPLAKASLKTRGNGVVERSSETEFAVSIHMFSYYSLGPLSLWSEEFEKSCRTKNPSELWSCTR